MALILDWSKGIPANATDQIAQLVSQLTTEAANRNALRKEIADTYRDYPDAFEMLEAAGVTLAEVEDALGQDAYAEYAAWLYMNVK